MPRKKKPGYTQFKLRISDELRERLEKAAAARGVSLNHEAVERLERSLELDLTASSWKAGRDLLPRLSVIGTAMDRAGARVFRRSEKAPTWLADPRAVRAAIDAVRKELDEWEAAIEPDLPSPPEEEPQPQQSALPPGLVEELRRLLRREFRTAGLFSGASAFPNRAGSATPAPAKKDKSDE